MSDTVNVPREPTEAMIDAGARVIREYEDLPQMTKERSARDFIARNWVGIIWPAMNDAAPITPAEQWRDISTHDGSKEPVVLFFPDFAPLGVTIGFYRAPVGDCYYPGQWLDDLNNEPFEVDKGEVFPTHWQPLPPPPSGECTGSAEGSSGSEGVG